VTPRFKVSDVISPWLNLVFSTEEYMPRDVCNNNFSFYVGKSFTEKLRGDEIGFPFHRLLPHTQKVYMSLGSQIYYYPHLFAAVAKALEGEDIQLVFSINELYHTPFLGQLPSHVIAVPYTPQLKILPYMDLVITHGGANSVMESLAHGLPVALLPICNDQFLQAQFVTRAGVGVILDPQTPSLEIYRSQLLPLLKEGSPEKIRARNIGSSFQRHGGPAEAAALIQQLYKSRTPLLP
jgi:MGT family glycosyltransferase